MKKVTLKDVANSTGFSLSKVSRAINSTGAINDEDRFKIISVAKEMGYVMKNEPNLFVNDTEKVAVLIQKFDSYSVSYFLQYLNNNLLQNNIQVDYYTVEGAQCSEAELLEKVIEKNYRAIIYKPLKVYDSVQAVINQATTPIISFGQVYGNCININYDNKQLMQDMTMALYNADCRNFLYIGTFKNDIEVGARRFEGFLEIATEKDLIYRYLECKCDIDSSYELSGEVDFSEYDAVVCATDNLALGVHKRLLENKIVPGTDILLTGAGNNKITRAVTPELSTIDLDKDFVATLIVALLVEGKFQKKNYVAPHSLCLRKTT